MKQKKCSTPNQQHRKTDSGSIQLPCIYLKVKNSQRDYPKDMEYIYSDIEIQLTQDTGYVRWKEEEMGAGWQVFKGDSLEHLFAFF